MLKLNAIVVKVVCNNQPCVDGDENEEVRFVFVRVFRPCSWYWMLKADAGNLELARGVLKLSAKY